MKVKTKAKIKAKTNSTSIKPNRIRETIQDIKINSLRDFVSGVASGGLGANLSQTDAISFNNRYSAITLNRALLSQTYLEHGIVQVLIDQPIDDAFRGGIIIKCPELSSDDIKDIEAYLNNEQILLIYAQALKWSRLYGGAGIIINAGQDMTKPLKISAINETTPLEFYAADRWELSYSPQGNSLLDQLKQEDTVDCPYNYYGHKMHKENVIKLKGKEAPSLIRGQFGGWGVSELEKIIRTYNQYLKHQNVIYEVMDESKIDVYKIAGFNSSICTKDGAAKTASRITAASQIKNYQNALVLDSEDGYEQKTLGFAGLSEILTQIRIGLACDLRMPMTKLFGISSAGFNSGEDDIENYNSMIESEIRSKVKKGLILLLQIICQKVLGYIPDNLDFEFKPLRIMTNKEESMIKTESLSRIISITNGGLCTTEVAVELINNEKIFSIDLNPKESYSIEELKEMGIDSISEPSASSAERRG
jgi:phage-related protein (TIGR01555 family)